MFNELPIRRHFSKEMYFRLIAQFLLPQNIERILWLDIDMVCLRSLKDIYYQNFYGNSMVVCAESQHDGELLVKHKINLGIREESTYFNSGVLLMNLEKIRNQYSMEEIIGKSFEIKDKLLFPDQDILNVLYEGDVKYSNKYYNYQMVYKDEIEESDRDKIYLLHYTGAEKPWRIKCINKASKYYWKYEKMRGHYLKWLAVYSLHYIYKGIRKCYFKIRRYE